MNVTKGLRNIVCLCLIAAMILGLSTNPVSAASKKQKNAEATAAYRKFLVSDVLWDKMIGSDEKFAMMDINHDGVKEILVTGDETYHASIYAYIDGEVKEIDWAFAGGYCWFKNKNLAYRSTAHSGTFLEVYETFKNGKMVELAKADGYDYVDSSGTYGINYKYYIKGKEVTKKKHDAYVKKLTRKAKKAKITLHENTAKNRKKYVK